MRDRLIADARDAIAYLRAQPGIDPARIYVLGHSEGGELAPSIAIADGKLSGIVLMAPPALPLEKILMQQVLRTVAPADREKTEQAEDGGAQRNRRREENRPVLAMASQLVRHRPRSDHRKGPVSDIDSARRRKTFKFCRRTRRA